jgi:hypothetical protein
VEVPGERLIVTLVNLPRYKVDLIYCETGGDPYFLLRSMKFSAPDNMKGQEIKLVPDTAELLRAALKREMEPGLDAHPSEIKSTADRGKFSYGFGSLSSKIVHDYAAGVANGFLNDLAGGHLGTQQTPQSQNALIEAFITYVAKQGNAAPRKLA